MGQAIMRIVGNPVVKDIGKAVVVKAATEAIRLVAERLEKFGGQGHSPAITVT